MFFEVHRNKINIAFLIILLFKSDVSAFNSVIQQIKTQPKKYAGENSVYHHLFFQNNQVINRYTFSTYNKFYYPDIKGHTITSKYVRALTRRLLDKSLDIEIMRENFSMIPEKNSSDIYKETASDIQKAEKSALINSIWNAGIEVYKSSAFYQRVQYYEYEIRKYFIIEYSKSISDTSPGFYLPGELSNEKKNQKKEYQISLSTLVAPDNESAKMDMTVDLATLFFHNRARLSYSMTRGDTGFNIFNSSLNSYLGADLIFHIEKIFNDDSVYRLSISLRY